MTRTNNWTDEDWLLLLQLYLRKPVGLKPPYSRPVVDLALELHVPPGELFARMCSVANLETPLLERMWQKYGANPRRLARVAALLRSMRGFGNAEAFYSGVAVCQTFERDFLPVGGLPGVKPVMLVLILDLYFRLTPPTMVARTPEVAELGRLMRVGADLVVDAMAAYRCSTHAARCGLAMAMPTRWSWLRMPRSCASISVSGPLRACGCGEGVAVAGR